MLIVENDGPRGLHVTVCQVYLQCRWDAEDEVVVIRKPLRSDSGEVYFLIGQFKGLVGSMEESL